MARGYADSYEADLAEMIGMEVPMEAEMKVPMPGLAPGLTPESSWKSFSQKPAAAVVPGPVPKGVVAGALARPGAGAVTRRMMPSCPEVKRDDPAGPGLGL